MKKIVFFVFVQYLAFTILAVSSYAGSKKEWVKAGEDTVGWAASGAKLCKGDVREAPRYIKKSWDVGKSVGRATSDTSFARKVGEKVASNKQCQKFSNSKTGKWLLSD